MEGEIPSQGLKELYKANLVAGRVKVTNNLLIRFPSLGDIKADKVAVEPPKEVVDPSNEPTKAEIKVQLEAQGIEYKQDANKAELLKLLKSE